MEYIILLIIIVLVGLVLRYIFDVNMKKIKEIGTDTELDELTKKYPDNIDICREYLKMLGNEDVNIEEDKNSNSTLYLVMSNKIFIANLRESYTRIQTIAHECLHSIQSKKMLWFNFIFSNIYIIYFVVICILGILKLLPFKMMFLSILLVMGLVFYSVRVYLENDAMIKARFLAKEYMQNKAISTKQEIDRIVSKFDKLNEVGIKCINYKFLNNVLIKCAILLIIFTIR